jgi:hypothetical protein
MNEYEKFRESYRRVPMVGDPQTATDVKPRGVFAPGLQRSSETSVPTPGARPDHGPITPNTTPAPPLPGQGR